MGNTVHGYPCNQMQNKYGPPAGACSLRRKLFGKGPFPFPLLSEFAGETKSANKRGLFFPGVFNQLEYDPSRFVGIQISKTALVVSLKVLGDLEPLGLRGFHGLF